MCGTMTVWMPPQCRENTESVISRKNSEDYKFTQFLFFHCLRAVRKKGRTFTIRLSPHCGVFRRAVLEENSFPRFSLCVWGGGRGEGGGGQGQLIQMTGAWFDHTLVCSYLSTKLNWLKGNQGSNASSSGRRRLWSACADLSRPWVYLQFL